MMISPRPPARFLQARNCFAGLLGIACWALYSSDAQACATCFDPNGEVRWSFIGTTIFLTVLPLMVLFSSFYWLRKRLREQEVEDDAARAAGRSANREA